MKKIFIAIMLLFAINITTMYADDVILHPTGSDHFQGNKPKMPAAPIHVDQDGFTITFGEGCICCPITLIDEDENIVYTTVVNEEGIVELLGSLSGTFELQLERGGITFVGVIEL
jgi:hypothetical protein